jgi:hypothetical protein
MIYKFAKSRFIPCLFAFALAVCVSSAADDKKASSSAAPTAKVTASREKAFADSKTIIVPTVFLKLPISGKVFVAKQGSALSTLGGGNANSVKASARYTVAGLDKALAQKIAGRVYDDLVAKLREAGYTVKTYEDIKNTDVVKSAQQDKFDSNWSMPTEKDPSGNAEYVVASPSDAQTFKTGLVGGVFNQFMKQGKSKLGEGTILMPTYVIAAPQAWGETGSGYNRISAEVNVAPGMNLTSAMVQLLTEKGGWGSVNTKEQIINIGEKVGELSKDDTTSHAGNAISKGLSILSGAGSIKSSSANYQMKIEAAAYEAGVLNGAAAFNAEVARVAGAQIK